MTTCVQQLTLRWFQDKDGFWACSIDGIGTCGVDENGAISNIQPIIFRSRRLLWAKAHALQYYVDGLLVMPTSTPTDGPIPRLDSVIGLEADHANGKHASLRYSGCDSCKAKSELETINDK